MCQIVFSSDARAVSPIQQGELHKKCSVSELKQYRRTAHDLKSFPSRTGRPNNPAIITVFGVGGAGGNAVNNIESKRTRWLLIRGLPTRRASVAASQGGRTAFSLGIKRLPKVWVLAARRSVGAACCGRKQLKQIVDHLAGAHMCFITAGMAGHRDRWLRQLSPKRTASWVS